MEIYNDNPANQYFDDTSLDVRQSGDDYETLYIRYDFFDQSVAVDIYSQAQRGYLLHETFTKDDSAGRVKTVFNQVTALSDVKIPAVLKKRVTEFITYAGEGFGFSEVALSEDTGSYCDQCGSYDSNSIQGYYFPYPVPSVAVGWDFGCFGGSIESGSVEDVSDGALRLLADARKSAEKDVVAKTINNFSKKLAGAIQ